MSFNPFEIEMSGAQMIEASAGTGKTYSLTDLYVRILLENELYPKQLLVTTFTDKATQEIKQEVLNRLKSARDLLIGKRQPESRMDTWLMNQSDSEKHLRTLTRALAMFEESAISTIHGFCLRTLKNYAFELGFNTDSELMSEHGTWIKNQLHLFMERELVNMDDTVWWALQNLHELDLGPFRLKEKLASPKLFNHLAKLAQLATQTSIRFSPPSNDLEFNKREAPAIFHQAKKLWKDGVPVHILVDDNLSFTKFSKKKQNSLAKSVPEYFFESQYWFELPEFSECYAYTHRTTIVNKNKTAQSHLFFDVWEELLDEASRYKNSLREAVLAFLNKLIYWFRHKEKELRDSENIITFDDQLNALHSGLESNPELAAMIRQDYPFALVDEFQDTDQVQYSIFKKLHQAGQVLFLIGDPKQAIYGFRGADLETYLKARQELPKQVHNLDVNYRSDPAILEAVEQLYQKHPSPFDHQGIQFTKVQPAPQAVDHLTLKSNAFPPVTILDHRKNKKEKLIVEDLKWSLENLKIGSKQLQLSDVAILVRSDSQAQKIISLLQPEDIPYIYSGKNMIWESEICLDLTAWIRAIEQPQHAGKIRTALATRICNLNLADLIQLQQESDEWAGYLEIFQQACHTWQAQSFARMWQFFKKHFAVDKNLLGCRQGKRHFTDFNHLIELILEQDFEGPEACLAWIEKQRQNRTKQEALRLEEDKNCVTIMTIHKSKGLQFPVVYLPYLNTSNHTQNWVVFTDQQGQKTVSLDPHFRQEQSKQEAEQGDLRLLYVALTRAKHRMVMSLASGGYKDEGPSAFGTLCKAWPGKYREIADTLPHLFELRDESRENHWTANEKTGIRKQPPQKPQRTFSPFRVASYSRLATTSHQAEIRDVFDQPKQVETQPIETSLGHFPKGAKAGNFFHNLFEFTHFQKGFQLAFIEEKLNQAAYPLEFGPTIQTALNEILKVPLGFGSLSNLQTKDRLNEMEFHIPIPNHNLEQITPENLAKIFVEFAPEHLRFYAESIKRLSFKPFHGFLIGFIDLVFRVGEKYFLADYKSNDLGPNWDDYNQKNIEYAMAEHHYFLQYHLYTLALHRYLKTKMTNYDYDMHMGGSYYFFIRGMTPKQPDLGWIFDRPKREMIEALDRFFGGEP